MPLTFGAATSDHVDFGAAASLEHTDASAFTLLLAFKISAFTAGRCLYSKRQSPDNGGHRLRLSGTGELEWQCFSDPGTNGSAVSDSLSLTPDVWYLGGFTYDRTDSNFVRFYIGTLTSPAAEPSYSSLTSDTGSPWTNSAQPLLIGNRESLDSARGHRGCRSRASAFVAG
jgi:hypothetical protein